LLAITDYIFFSCANVKPPQGGPRDTIPPSLIESVPANKSLNFSGNIIQLTFDEYLKIDNLNSKLIITPYFDSEFEIKFRKTFLEIEFEKPFNDSTTYTFNFQDAIQDITEKNAAKNNVLAFSTGPYIDSLNIFGKVTDLLTGDILENITIGLYQATDTSDLFIGNPMYFTKTNEFGIFLIENIKNNHYRIAAFDDSNSNLKCDVKSEGYAFKKDTLNLMSQIEDSIYMNILSLDISDLKVQRKSTSGLYYEVRSNKYITDYNLKYDSSYFLYSHLLPDNKIIRFYNTFDKDSLEVFIDLYDSINNTFTDTLNVKFAESKRKKGNFNLQITPKNKSKVFSSYEGLIQFNKPVISMVYDSIFFKYDSATISHFNPETDFKWNKFKTELSVKYMLDPLLLNKQPSDSTLNTDTENNLPNKSATKKPVNTKKNKLLFYLGKGAFISADNDSSLTYDTYYTFYEETDLSTLKGVIETSHNSFIIQLLNNKFKVLDEIKNQHEYAFTNVVPDTYRIRVLVDNNNNGVWDPGNYTLQREPEDVYLYSEEILLRANWEVVDINISF
jgi:hypothetical protein